MNYCSLEEAFGIDPFDDFKQTMTSNNSDVSMNATTDLEQCNFDVATLDSYSAFSNPNQSNIELQHLCDNSKPKTTFKTKSSPKKNSPVPVQYTNNTRCSRIRSLDTRHSEIVNAVIYILSGIYVIFILDLFARMGAHLN